MFFTVAGVPGGYGYFEIPSVADENIIPKMVEYLKTNDPNKKLNPVVSIGTMAIQVSTECLIRINGRAPVMVTPDTGISFDARNVYDLRFVETGINYNIAVSY